MDAAFYLLREVAGLLLLLPRVSTSLSRQKEIAVKPKLLSVAALRIEALYVKTLSFWVHVRLNLPVQCSILPLFHTI